MSGQEQARDVGREAEVRARLATVTDPELDEPVTDLGFVEGVTVAADGAVAIDFSLPTYWCAANFAYMMAEDMRDAVATLPWVTGVVPRLHAHMCADQVNRGVAEGLDFGARLRRGGEKTTLSPACARPFDARRCRGGKRRWLRALLVQGVAKSVLVAMTVQALEGTAIAGAEGASLKRRYLEIRARVGGPAGADALAFVTPDGAPLSESGFDEHLRTLASVRIAMDFKRRALPQPASPPATAPPERTQPEGDTLQS